MSVALLAGAYADISELVNADPHDRLNGLKFIKHGFSYKFGDDVNAGGAATRSGASAGGNAGSANNGAGSNANGNANGNANRNANGNANGNAGYEDHSETGYGRDVPENEVNKLLILFSFFNINSFFTYSICLLMNIP